MGATRRTADLPPTRDLRPLRFPAILLGVGLGGFVDGILFHQVLQLHHMLSNAGQDRIGLTTPPVTTVAGLEANTLWDGLFHTATYLFVLVGLLMLWQAWRELALPAHRRPSWTLLVGGILVGWGFFNLVEGVVDHHLLQIHHVRAGDHELLWDLLFLLAGAGLVLVGWMLIRASEAKATKPPQPT